MVLLRLTAPTLHCEEVVAELYAAGVEGITEEPLGADHTRLDAFFADDQQASQLAHHFARFSPEILPVDTRDWVAHARALWSPVEVGDRFYLAPEWDATPAVPEGRILLPMPAGQGFGSGSHETTRLAISALEGTRVEGASVLDIGTGSGILLAAAHRLGARSLTGCDIDPVAVSAARDYLDAQRIPASLYLGSVDAVRGQRFQVVLANLNATLILNLLDELFATIQPHGRLILSGILTPESDAIHRALESFPRVTRIYHSALGDWVNFRVATG